MKQNKAFIMGPSKFVFAVLLCTVGNVVYSQNSLPQLNVLFIFDGLRYDFLSPEYTPTMWALAKGGVYSPKGIAPQVWTTTMGNMVSIATGLYQESHGIVGNAIYDPEWDEYFDYFNLYSDNTTRRTTNEAKWYSGEPIWQTAEKAGLKTACIRYPSCEVSYNGGLRARRILPYTTQETSLIDWQADMDQMVNWMRDGEVTFALVAVPEPDRTEHRFDIHGQEVKQVIAQCDRLIAYLMRKLRDANLDTRTNIIFTSDHGHSNTYVDFTHIGASSMLSPVPFKISEHSVFPVGTFVNRLTYH
jgi:ectonucleotide pyrophosphatase/phosphodiesterase family protein 5